MILRVLANETALSAAAAELAARDIAEAIQKRRTARVVAATGNSQIEFLELLSAKRDVDWQRVELFQLDEYVGLSMTHAASFSRYLHERLVAKTGLVRWHSLNGADRPEEVIRRASAAIAEIEVDIACVGIGENGHLAFNDPPADFVTKEPYIRVQLDEACRGQQVGEGWFADLAAVPKEAISMSPREILRAKKIIGVVPEGRKAAAVKACFEGEVSPLAPASILRTHGDTTIFLDQESASLLSGDTLRRFTPEDDLVRGVLRAASKLEVPE